MTNADILRHFITICERLDTKVSVPDADGVIRNRVLPFVRSVMASAEDELRLAVEALTDPPRYEVGIDVPWLQDGLLLQAKKQDDGTWLISPAPLAVDGHIAADLALGRRIRGLLQGGRGLLITPTPDQECFSVTVWDVSPSTFGATTRVLDDALKQVEAQVKARTEETGE